MGVLPSTQLVAMFGPYHGCATVDVTSGYAWLYHTILLPYLVAILYHGCATVDATSGYACLVLSFLLCCHTYTIFCIGPRHRGNCRRNPHDRTPTNHLAAQVFSVVLLRTLLTCCNGHVVGSEQRLDCYEVWLLVGLGCIVHGGRPHLS